MSNEEVMIPKSYHDKVCEEMARRHQAEILELTKDRPSDPHNITYINALKNRIRELEAKRPQGEWEQAPTIHRPKWHACICSVCGKSATERTAFCPNCGCRMKGADDE